MMVIRKGGISIGPSQIPGRKNPSLVVMQQTGEGTIVKPYASFKSREDADEFMKILADFVGAIQVGDPYAH